MTDCTVAPPWDANKSVKPPGRGRPCLEREGGGGGGGGGIRREEKARE